MPRSRRSRSGSISGAPAGNPADMPPPRQFADVDKWHIGKPDMVVTLPKPYELRANGPDEFYDVDVDPGFTEDMYIAAVETKPEAYSFKVVHHATVNMIEDEEEDPVGLFFNEYALGKNGDIFPRDSGRLIKAGSKLHFNLHLHPSGERSLRQPLDRLQAVSEGPGAEVRRVHAAHGRQHRPRHPAGRGRAQRRLLPPAAGRRCSRRSSRTCTIAARRCAWKRSTRTSAPTRRVPARRAPKRSTA